MEDLPVVVQAHSFTHSYDKLVKKNVLSCRFAGMYLDQLFEQKSINVTSCSQRAQDTMRVKCHILYGRRLMGIWSMLYHSLSLWMMSQEISPSNGTSTTLSTCQMPTFPER